MPWGDEGDSNEVLAELVGSAPVVVLRLDVTGVVTSISGQGVTHSGQSAEALRGRSVFDLFSDSATVVAGARRAITGETVTSTVEAWGCFWDAHFKPVRTGAEITGVVALWMECTARERLLVDAQRELRFVDSVLENVPNMIFVKDARDLRFLRFNRAGEELLGHSREEMLGKNDYDFFPRAEADFFTAKDRAVLASGQLLDIPEEPIETVTKGKRYLRTKKIPMHDERGQPLYLIGISEDITEWRALDEERRKVLDTLLDLDHMKAQLIANVSHELRTPLTIILLITERLMRLGDGRPEWQRDLTEIDRSARALLALVKDLLDASKLEAGQLRAEYANVDLARLVRLTTSSLDSMARSIPVTLIVETPESLSAQVDPDRVQHILTNLLSNAFKHAPPGGVVRCTLEQRGELARMSVSDNGAGVPKELRSRVFERFFQAPGDPARAGGTGLGLSIVKDFTELHGGNVFVDDAPEGGARFVVDLPLMAPPDAVVRVPARPLEIPSAHTVHAPVVPRLSFERTPGGPPDDRPRVLLVEDNADMRRLMLDALEERYRVVAASDGAEGLDRALREPPDLIVTDLMMPRMTGDQLVHEARRHPELASVPILVVTARDDDALRVDLLRGGAQDFVTKPFSAEELFARIDNLVTIKRTREVLQRALESGRNDIEVLARDLAARGDELRGAYADASSARRRAESSSQAKTEFLALVSHELRSPMTALRLRLDLLSRRQTEPLSPGQAALVGRMAGAAERLFDIAQSLVELVGVETSGTAVAVGPVDVAALASTVLESVSAEAASKRLVLRQETAPDLPLLTSDEHLVRVILANLIGNAVKFTERGEVVVSLADVEGDLRIEVKDTGPGIPEGSRTRIFEPFQHLEPLSHKHTRGAGVGLAIVRRAVEALGGRIQLASPEGGGTTFTVTLPTRQPPV
jgi:PAS domain S-box-containing protein